MNRNNAHLFYIAAQTGFIRQHNLKLRWHSIFSGGHCFKSHSFNEEWAKSIADTLELKFPIHVIYYSCKYCGALTQISTAVYMYLYHYYPPIFSLEKKRFRFLDLYCAIQNCIGWRGIVDILWFYYKFIMFNYCRRMWMNLR